MGYKENLVSAGYKDFTEEQESKIKQVDRLSRNLQFIKIDESADPNEIAEKKNQITDLKKEIEESLNSSKQKSSSSNGFFAFLGLAIIGVLIAVSGSTQSEK